MSESQQNEVPKDAKDANKLPSRNWLQLTLYKVLGNQTSDPVSAAMKHLKLRYEGIHELNNYVRKSENVAAVGVPLSHNNFDLLVITDFMVETAMQQLETSSESAKKGGRMWYLLGIGIILGTLVVSGILIFDPLPVPKTTMEAVLSVIKGFTFYGLAVLGAVKCLGIGRALLDQSERFRDRRHALRQGRLFIHLRRGNISLNELERAFSWNTFQPNAFNELKTDAKAPLGALAESTLATLAAIGSAKRAAPPS
jgi:hypothetical protein